ncbi:hypothetical protein K438DRAFT_1731550 [Mycena galopus ATCC 62051]|nr:hypothetical protein K438DRAFT_1731550 [Mycena galopus ATCC 62051]
MESLNGDTDGILIFLRFLFRDFLATFITQSYTWLQPPPLDPTNTLLSQISLQLSIMSNGTEQFPNPLRSGTAPFQTPIYAILINALWFLSLLFSILCALSATLLQQWSRYYIHAAQRTAPPHIRGPAHMKLSYGLERFRVRFCVELIILLLHLAVTLFLAGLIMLLYNLNTLVTYIFLIFSALAAMAYVFLSITPILFDDAPFRTPLTPFLAGIHTFMSPLLAPTMHLWPSRSPRRQEIPAELSLQSLQIHRMLDLSLRAV